jgi:hypothetical protein
MCSNPVYYQPRLYVSACCSVFPATNTLISSSLYFSYLQCVCEPGGSVGVATDYGLDGLGIESRCGRDFSQTSKPALGPTQPPVQWVPGLSQG